ncbi:MAG: hypothetical protein R3E63_04435 [Pseudomonadales bacterium]
MPIIPILDSRGWCRGWRSILCITLSPVRSGGRLCRRAVSITAQLFTLRFISQRYMAWYCFRGIWLWYVPANKKEYGRQQ